MADRAKVSRRRIGPHNKPGPKVDGDRARGKKKSLQILLFEEELNEFHALSKRLNHKNNTETLLYLMKVEKTGGELPGQRTSTPTKRKLRRIESIRPDFDALDLDDNAGQSDAELQGDEDTSQLGDSDRWAMGDAISQVGDTMSQVGDTMSQVGDTIFSSNNVQRMEEADSDYVDEDDGGSVDVYEFNEDDSDRPIIPRRAEFASYLQRSLQVDDGRGVLLGTSSKPSSAMAPTEQTDDPRQYDFSASPRLLPDGYYTKISQGLQCKLHVPKTYCDNDIAGVVENPRHIRANRHCLELAQEPRYIVELQSLIKLMSPKCYFSGCSELNDFTTLTVKTYGAVCLITIHCKAPLRHKKMWSSSRRMQHRSQNNVRFYALNTLIPCAAATSGQHFRKLDLFCRALNLRNISPRQFTRIQKAVALPAVMDAWITTQSMMRESLTANEMRVILASDGQFDSPGKCAQFCTVSNMIIATIKKTADGKEEQPENNGYICALEVIDKRHTGGKSPTMEVVGTLRALMQSVLRVGIDVKELVTDQNLSLMKLLKMAKTNKDAFVARSMKHLEHFPNANNLDYHALVCITCDLIDHQLDVWHRAKNIGKALVKKSVPKAEKQDYLKWVTKIKNHFFWCCQHADGDEKKLKVYWMSLLHHCRGVHEWTTGHCEHALPHERQPDDPPYLDPESKSFMNIRTVISDPKLLNDLGRYKKFWQTSLIESFNSLSLAYAPKRTKFDWFYYTMRKTLAALDWNNNLHRPIVRHPETLVPIYTLRYSKRAKKVLARPRKEPNVYEHVPHLLALCLHKRSTSTVRFHNKAAACNIDVPWDPRRIAKNTAPFQEVREVVIQRHREMTRMGRLSSGPQALSKPADGEGDDSSGDESSASSSEDYGSALSDSSCSSEEDSE